MTGEPPMVRIVERARMEAPAPRVYAMLADYRNGHPRILPRPPFTELVVEEGGVGDGTRIRVGMRFAGRTRSLRAVVTEPDPGHVLAETYPETGAVTTFTVEAEGGETVVTIATDLPVRDGLLGRLEAWAAARMLRPTYRRELALLAAAAAEPAAAPPP